MQTRLERLEAACKDARERIAAFTTNEDKEAYQTMAKHADAIRAFGNYMLGMLRLTDNPDDWADLETLAQVEHRGEQTLNLISRVREALLHIEFYRYPVTYIKKGERFSTVRVRYRKEVPWLSSVEEKTKNLLNLIIDTIRYLDGKSDLRVTPKDVSGATRAINSSVKEFKKFKEIIIALGLYKDDEVTRGIKCLQDVCKVILTLKGTLIYKHKQCLKKMKGKAC